MSNARQIELYLICRLIKPEIVIETGVEHGISTALILQALKKTQKEFSILLKSWNVFRMGGAQAG